MSGTSPIRRALRWLGIAALLALFAAAMFWWWAGNWQPDRDRWPLQGVAVGPANTPLSWDTLAATGAEFAYIDAILAGTRPNAGFTTEHDRAVAAGVRVGAVHHYDLCQPANAQAAAFVTRVPREAYGLPAAVMIADDPDCRSRPSRALLLSELTTFLNQIETHLGKPAILAPAPDVDAEYQVTDAINRPLWVQRNWREPPADASRPWVVWQANDRLRSDGANGTVRRLVLNGAGL
jgi:lysozyme